MKSNRPTGIGKQIKGLKDNRLVDDETYISAFELNKLEGGIKLIVLVVGMMMGEIFFYYVRVFFTLIDE